jgi:ABC-type multidrug transport system ATPase subunit
MAGSLDSHSQPLLEVQNLSKRFGDSAALTNISFSVLEKEIVGVIGPNGAGKTTLLECVAGLLHPDSGTISWQKRALHWTCPAQLPPAFFVSPNAKEQSRAMANANVLPEKTIDSSWELVKL